MLFSLVSCPMLAHREATSVLKVGDAERKCASLAADFAKLKEDTERQQNIFYASVDAATNSVCGDL